jgi:hypothetical protein
VDAECYEEGEQRGSFLTDSFAGSHARIFGAGLFLQLRPRYWKGMKQGQKGQRRD